MPESDIVIKVSTDVSKLQSDMDKIKQQVRTVGADATATGKKIDQSFKPTNPALLKKNYEDVSRELSELNQQLRDELALKNKNASATAKRIQNLQKEKNAIDRQAQAMTKTRSIGQSLNNTFTKLGVTIGIAFAARAIINFTKASIEAYDVQAKAEQRLLVALKGREDVQKRLLSQASARQKLTLFGDEETIAAQSALAALIKEGDAIEALIPLVQDFSTAKGVDLVTAADLVGKAVGSSTNALSRYGVTITGAVGSQERLETAVNSLSEAFGGQAEAAAKAGVGPLKQLSNAYGDLKEQIGGVIAEGVAGLAKSFTEAVTATTAYIQASPIDEILQEKEAFKVLTAAAVDETLEKERRIEILGKMRKQEPEFLKGLDLEKVGFDQIQEGVSDVLKSYDRRIRLMNAQITVQNKLNSINEIALEIDDLRNNAARLQAGTFEDKKRDLELTNKFANVATDIVDVMPEWAFWIANTSLGGDIRKDLIEYNKNLAKHNEYILKVTKAFADYNATFTQYAETLNKGNKLTEKENAELAILEQSYLKLGGTQEGLNNIREHYLQQSTELTGGVDGGGGGAIGNEKSAYEALTSSINDLKSSMLDMILLNQGDLNITKEQIIEKEKLKRRVDGINEGLLEFIELAAGPIQELEEKGVEIPLEIEFPTELTKRDDAAKIAGEETALSFVDGFNIVIAEIKDNKEVQDALRGLLNTLADSFEEILTSNLDAEREMIENQIDLYDELISAQEQRVSEQERLQKEGSASNVRIEKERLEKLQTEREQAIKERQKQVQKERELERTLAVVKAATAATQVIAAESGKGVAGVIIGIVEALALVATIATLFSTADSQIKYAHGTAQVLGGKPHSQGGTSLGEFGEAEKGEFLGILSKDKTQKYGSAMMTLFDGINKQDSVKAQMGLLELAGLQDMPSGGGEIALKEIPEIKGIYNEIKKQPGTVTYDGKYRIEKNNGRIRKIYVQ